MSHRSLGYLALGVTNLQEWVSFAENILGMMAVDVSDSGVRLRMDERVYRLELRAAPAAGLSAIGWDVGSKEELHGVCEGLRAGDLSYEMASTSEAAERNVAGLVRFKDPGGNPLEAFFGQEVTSDPFVPGRPISDFVTGEMGLGHVVLNVPDLDEAGAFYSRVLGFRVTDVYPGRLIFMHCNPRHHSLALVKSSQGAELQHVMIECGELDDVGRAYDFCRSRGMKITQTLGRHANDYMVSFYVRGPSGFDIEYGWGARTIDTDTWAVNQFSRPSIWGHDRP